MGWNNRTRNESEMATLTALLIQNIGLFPLAQILALNTNIMNDSNICPYAEIWIVSPTKQLDLYGLFPLQKNSTKKLKMLWHFLHILLNFQEKLKIPSWRAKISTKRSLTLPYCMFVQNLICIIVLFSAGKGFITIFQPWFHYIIQDANCSDK